MTVELKPYQPGDESAICELFQLVFGKNLSLEFWRSRYLDHPAGGPYAELAWDEGELVGHYAASAATLAVNGSPCRAALSMTTMTHPNYRGQRLFERLAERLYGRLADGGVQLIYGFPNRNSHRGLVKRLAWQSIYEIPILMMETSRRTVPARIPPEVRVVGSVGAEFDTFWDRIRHSYPFWIWRDRAYLDWRFVRNPISEYRIAGWYDGEDLLGFCVTKVYLDESLDVVELIAFEDRVVKGLLDWCLREAREKGVPKLVSWVPLASPIRLQLESGGFAASGPVTYFGARVFSQMPNDLFDHRNWMYAMGDSDVY